MNHETVNLSRYLRPSLHPSFTSEIAQRTKIVPFMEGVLLSGIEKGVGKQPLDNQYVLILTLQYVFKGHFDRLGGLQ